MANILTPFGFQQYLGGAGGAPTFSQSVRRIAAGNTTKIFTGDPVVEANSANSGYITQGSNGYSSTPLAGIFVGCRYQSISQNRVVWSQYWPGADCVGDAEAYVIDDPATRFLVQSSWASPLAASLATLTNSPVGRYCDYTIGTGNTSNGRSGAYVSSLATTATFPFIVTDLQIFPPGANGTDPTTQYYNVIVGFNNEAWRNNAAVTGIA